MPVLLSLVIVGALVRSSLGVDVGAVPPEAKQVAQSVLDNKWKREAGESPEAYGLPAGADVSTATLMEPFVVQWIRGEALEEYLASKTDDPRSFPCIYDYCFPIVLADGERAGAVIVRRNRDEELNKLFDDQGEYMPLGYYRRGKPVIAGVEQLRREFGDTAWVSLVQYVDAGVQFRYFVEDKDGRLYSGASIRSLAPVGRDATSVKDTVRTFRKNLRKPSTDNR